MMGQTPNQAQGYAMTAAHSNDAAAIPALGPWTCFDVEISAGAAPIQHKPPEDRKSVS